tara:strand:- start:148 stop:1377 length:1230 start_codon:yes stop_codon:yes gene_type:complete
MKKKSLFSLIFSTFVITSLGAIIIIFLILNTHFKHNEKILLTKISTQINRTIIEKTTHYLLPAILVTDVSAKLAKNTVIDINNHEQIESYLMTQIKAYPQLSKVYLGKENGDFIMVYRDETKSLATKIISQKTKHEHIKDYNLYGDIISTKTIKTNYDPRTRQWYNDTKEKEAQIWTDLYMFYTGKRPGITASYPLFDKHSNFQGVFGVDLELAEISEFLSFQKLYYDSKILILNYKNEIVAQSGNILFKTSQDGQVSPLHINNHSDALIQEAYKKLMHVETKLENNKQVSLSYNNDSYLISSVSFPEYFGKKWKVMTILPNEQLLDNRMSSKLVFSILCLMIIIIICVIAILLSRSISIPLKQLSFDMQRLRYKNVDGKNIKSSIIEINELVDVYSIIKTSFIKTFKK